MDKLEYRGTIKFLTLKGDDYKHIHQQLLDVYHDQAPSLSTCKRLNREFRMGRTSIQDEPRSGRPSDATTPETIAQVRSIIDNDPRAKIRHIAASMSLSYGTVSTIIHDQLHLNKLSARWVPRNLSPQEREKRVTQSCEILELAYADPENFLSRLVTEDESWVHHYDPESKQDSFEWREKGQPPPTKFRKQPSAGKVLLTVFWDQKGVLLTDYLQKGHTITGLYYADLLRKLRTNIREKRRGLLTRGVLLLQDNAPAHTSQIGKAPAAECGFELVSHPAFYPDMAPCDYYLFSKLKKQLNGKRYDRDESVIGAVEESGRGPARDILRRRPARAFRTA